MVWQPAEDVNFSTWHGEVDLVFTSPPYFDLQRYADQPKARASVVITGSGLSVWGYPAVGYDDDKDSGPHLVVGEAGAVIFPFFRRGNRP